MVLPALNSLKQKRRKKMVHLWSSVIMSYGSFFPLLSFTTKIISERKAHSTDKRIIGIKPFFFNLDTVLTGNLMTTFLDVFQVSFKISRVQIFDDMRYCVVESRTIMFCYNENIELEM